MISVFLRAVIFGLGVEAGREVYKVAKAKLTGGLAPQEAPPVDEADDRDLPARAQAVADAAVDTEEQEETKKREEEASASPQLDDEETPA